MMKLIKRSLLAVLLVSWVTGTPLAVGNQPPADTSTPKITLYYFHTTARCSTCMKIETMAHEALQESYSDELASGALKWQVVNIETPENRHFVQDFKLITKALVLVDESGGKPPRWKNLEKIWELVWSPESYKNYVRSELAGFIKGR